MTLSTASSHIKMVVFSAILLLSPNAYGQKQSDPLTQQKNPIGTAQPEKTTPERALTEPSQPVVPDQFKQGQLYEDVTTHEWRITKLEDEVKMMLTDINFAKGASWFLGGVIVIIVFIIAKWWKPIVQYFLKDAYAD